MGLACRGIRLLLCSPKHSVLRPNPIVFGSGLQRALHSIGTSAKEIVNIPSTARIHTPKVEGDKRQNEAAIHLLMMGLGPNLLQALLSKTNVVVPSKGGHKEKKQHSVAGHPLVVRANLGPSVLVVVEHSVGQDLGMDFLRLAVVRPDNEVVQSVKIGWAVGLQGVHSGSQKGHHLSLGRTSTSGDSSRGSVVRVNVITAEVLASPSCVIERTSTIARDVEEMFIIVVGQAMTSRVHGRSKQRMKG